MQYDVNMHPNLFIYNYIKHIFSVFFLEMIKEAIKNQIGNRLEAWFFFLPSLILTPKQITMNTSIIENETYSGYYHCSIILLHCQSHLRCNPIIPYWNMEFLPIYNGHHSARAPRYNQASVANQFPALGGIEGSYKNSSRNCLQVKTGIMR